MRFNGYVLLPLFPFLAICFTAQVCIADDLSTMRGFVEDGIATNLGRIQSFEATITSTEGSAFISRGKSLDLRKFDRHIYFDGAKWRQDISSTWHDPNKQRDFPYLTTTVFDGDKTLRYAPREQSAEIRGGNVMEGKPTKDVTYGYTFMNWPLPLTLTYASSIRLVDGVGDDHHGKMIEIKLGLAKYPGKITTLWLDPEAGFLIVKAEGRDPSGQVFSERRDTKTALIGGAWYLVSGKDAIWGFADDGARQYQETRDWDITIAHFNEPIPGTVFDVKYQGTTLVVDNTTGGKAIVGGTLSRRSTSAWARWIWMAILAGIFALFLVFYLVFLRRRASVKLAFPRRAVRPDAS